MTAPHRVLVTGSRSWKDYRTIHRALDTLLAAHPGMVLVSGACAQGADAIAERWAALHSIPNDRHPAKWATEGRGAGLARNSRMVAAGADVCVLFVTRCAKTSCPQGPDPHGSHGAMDCAVKAHEAGIPVRPYWAGFDFPAGWDRRTLDQEVAPEQGDLFSVESVEPSREAS